VLCWGISLRSGVIWSNIYVTIVNGWLTL
jgi:hypothetical protein